MGCLRDFIDYMNKRKSDPHIHQVNQNMEDLGKLLVRSSSNSQGPHSLLLSILFRRPCFDHTGLHAN